MIQNYPLHVPENSSPGECLGTFSTAIALLSLELGGIINERMEAKEGLYWFSYLIEDRKYQDSRYNNYKNKLDFSFLVVEICNFSDSPLRDGLPRNDPKFYNTLQDLLQARNRWYHSHEVHNIHKLSEALRMAYYISKKCGLDFSEELIPVINRVNDIVAGTYKSPVPVSIAKPTEGKTQEKPKAMRQAAVGASWLGPLGARKIQLAKSGSLVDLQKGENVTSELGNPAENRYLKLWKKLEIDWMWVDELGSVAAHVYGSLRMVGHWGSEPNDLEQDPFAKFLLSTTYAYAGEVFYERETSESLDESFVGQITKSTLNRGREMVQEGEVLRVTWDGDLICFGDQGPLYIGEVESEDWFPGHFFLPTTKG